MGLKFDGFVAGIILAIALLLHPSVSSAADCKSYRLSNGTQIQLDRRSFVDKVICPGPASSGCPNRPYVQGRYGENNQPENALGTPLENKVKESGFKAYSLGCNSSATWYFEDNVLADQQGDDLIIFELAFGAPEEATVEISEDGKSWIIVGTFSGGQSGIDIGEKAHPGASYRYIRLTDLGSSKCSSNAGADITAIAAYPFSKQQAQDETGLVFFETGKAELTSAGRDALQKLVQQAKQDGEIRVTIIGHTDSRGEPEDNLVLSQKRADAVKDFLAASGQVSAEKMHTLAVGEDKPVASNSTLEGQARNRRVEFIFTPIDTCGSGAPR